VFVKFRQAPPIYDGYMPPANYFRFRLNPDITIAMGATVRSADAKMAIEPMELLVSHQPSPQELDPYELLLGDAMKGDAFRFARVDYVDEAWRIVDPVLQSGGPVYEYAPGTWGPSEADAIVGEHRWHNPALQGDVPPR
jgi:glucose-6-phosphate 1-dehydrogenase